MDQTGDGEDDLKKKFQQLQQQQHQKLEKRKKKKQEKIKNKTVEAQETGLEDKSNISPVKQKTTASAFGVDDELDLKVSVLFYS